MAADWPQLLGPARNGICTESNLTLSWPKEGPRVLWKRPVGAGWSAPVVASGHTFVFHRSGGEEVLECLGAADGKSIWRSGYATHYRDDFGFDEGPRATPVVDAGRAFTLGADGVLTCWNADNGSNVWRIDTRRQFGSGKGFFGVASSPLVEGNVVILNVGGKQAGIVGFDRNTGAVLWKATDEEASYSSPVAAAFAGKRRVLVLARGSLVAIEPSRGTVLWSYPFRPAVEASVTAATPLVIGDLTFISASYGAGDALLRFAETKPEVVWTGEQLCNHYATSVFHDGFLFGFDGRQEQGCNLKCVELKTGKVRWSEEHFGAGTILSVVNNLLILTERGELIVAPASAEGFNVARRAQVMGFECRAYPALSNGRLYARDKAGLVCLEL